MPPLDNVEEFITDQEEYIDQYTVGYYSYWDGLELTEISKDQINGYLDAKYEVERNNTNF